MARDGTKTGGRQKGSQNKDTKAVREMVLEALSQAGGSQYLYQQSQANPVAFMAMVAKIMPTQLTGEDGGAIKMEDVTTPEQIESLKQWALLKYGTNPVTV